MQQYIYTTYSDFLSKHFDCKVQKISIDAGFTCPNRDGALSRGGCTYCNNRTFNPSYCSNHEDIASQLQKGKAFFARKYPSMKYLAYFQAYTNTYAPTDDLRRLYEEALSVDGVVGLVIGTRPDCVGNELLDYLSRLSEQTFVMLEYGVESSRNSTLALIRRGHDFASSVDAIRRTSIRGIHVGAHVILGLPGESYSDFMHQAEQMAKLPLDTLKLHHLQIIKGTVMERQYSNGLLHFNLFTPAEYASLVADYLERLPRRIAIERFASQSPGGMLVAPAWGLKNYEFTELVIKEMKRRGTCQGWLAESLFLPHP